MEGTLSCAGCAATYPIVRGVPRMNVSMEGLDKVARTFDVEWKAHHEGIFEESTLWGRTPAETWGDYLDRMMVPAARVAGAAALDAGCGSGQFTRVVAEHGPAMVIGLDLSDAVEEAAALCRDLPNVQIVQGNVLAPPFKPGVFDLVWCSGVLHHTPDAAGGHEALARLVKPGGVFYTYVFAKRFNPFRFTKDVLDALRVTRLPPRALLAISKAFAYVSVALLGIYRAVRRLPGLRPRGPWGERTVRARSLRHLHLTWFDALSPEHDSRHTEEEVIGWFERAGFTDIRAVEEPKVGVRGVAAGPTERTAPGP
jgi:SAM-dependent methyltransferase